MSVVSTTTQSDPFSESLINVYASNTKEKHQFQPASLTSKYNNDKVGKSHFAIPVFDKPPLVNKNNTSDLDSCASLDSLSSCSHLKHVT